MIQQHILAYHGCRPTTMKLWNVLQKIRVARFIQDVSNNTSTTMPCHSALSNAYIQRPCITVYAFNHHHYRLTIRRRKHASPTTANRKHNYWLTTSKFNLNVLFSNRQTNIISNWLTSCNFTDYLSCNNVAWKQQSSNVLH